GAETVRIAGRHQIQPVAGKSDDLRLDVTAVARRDIAGIAHRGTAADRLEGESDHAGEAALDRRWPQPLHVSKVASDSLAPAPGELALHQPLSVEFSRRLALSSPNRLAATAATRLSSRASIWDASARTRQPPRASVGSSISVQARSPAGAARCSRTSAASSGCRCTRTSRAAAG